MREELIEAAETLVQRRGFDAVTFQNIADAAGLRKPSVFHHIRNKEELGRLLIDRCEAKYARRYQVIIARGIPAPEKLKQIARQFDEGLKDGRPCLLAAIGRDRDRLTPDTESMLRGAAEETINRFAAVFQQGRDEGTLAFDGKPEHAAAAYVAMLQGLQNLCRTTGDLRAFRKATSTFIDAMTTTT